MATVRQLQQMHTLIWTLIYGGLLVVLLGASLSRLEPALGWSMVGGGAIVVAVGVVLIFVRARLKVDPDSNPETRS